MLDLLVPRAHEEVVPGAVPALPSLFPRLWGPGLRCSWTQFPYTPPHPSPGFSLPGESPISCGPDWMVRSWDWGSIPH